MHLFKYSAIEWVCHARTTVVAEDEGKRAVVAECSGHGATAAQSVAFARRIVACLNACQRIETELLEGFPGGLNGFSAVIIAKQRDELLAALEATVTAWEQGRDVFGGIQVARAAIAKAKGGAV